MILDSDTLIGESIFGGGTIAAMGRLGGPEALAALAGAVDRVIRAADAGGLDWQAQSVASMIAQTLADMRDPGTAELDQRLRARFDRLYVDARGSPGAIPGAARPAADDPALVLYAQRPLTSPSRNRSPSSAANRSGSANPTWPLEADGGPATFMAQFTIPGRDGLAYLFLDHSEDFTGDPGYLVVQPGPPPERYVASATGPTFWSEVTGPSAIRVAHGPSPGRITRRCSSPASTSMTGASSTRTL